MDGRYSSGSRYSTRPINFGTLAVPSSAQDKPFATRPLVAQTVLDLPEPVSEPPAPLGQIASPSAEIASSQVPNVFSGMDPQQSAMLRELPSAQPNIYYSPYMMGRSEVFGEKARQYDALANDFASGGRHDSWWGKFLPRFKARLSAQRAEALGNAARMYGLESDYAKAAYTIANAARNSDINATSVSATGQANLRGTPDFFTNNRAKQAGAAAGQTASDAQLFRATTPDLSEYGEKSQAVDRRIADGGISDHITEQIAAGTGLIAPMLGSVKDENMKRTLLMEAAANSVNQALTRGMGSRGFEQLIQDGAYSALIPYLPKNPDAASRVIQRTFPKQFIQSLSAKLGGDPVRVRQAMSTLAERILKSGTPVDFDAE